MRKPLFYIIIVIVIFFIGLFSSKVIFDKNVITETITVTKTDTVFKTIVDSTGFDTIIPKPVYVTINSPDPKKDSIVTKKYVGTKELENGTIDYEIFADSLYATDFKLTTKEKIITNTITNTITKTFPSKSMLFLGGGADVGLGDGLPQEISLGLMYNRRNKWAISATINKDLSNILPDDKSYSVGVSLFLPLFNKK